MKNDRNIVLLNAAGALRDYMEAADIADHAQALSFRPMTRDGLVAYRND